MEKIVETALTSQRSIETKRSKGGIIEDRSIGMNVTHNPP